MHELSYEVNVGLVVRHKLSVDFDFFQGKKIADKCGYNVIWL